MGTTTTTRSRTRKASKATASKRRVQFDSENSDHWHAIPSKGQLYAMAIATFNGATIDGAALGNRELAKAAVAAAKENGHLPA